MYSPHLFFFFFTPTLFFDVVKVYEWVGNSLIFFFFFLLQVPQTGPLIVNTHQTLKVHRLLLFYDLSVIRFFIFFLKDAHISADQAFSAVTASTPLSAARNGWALICISRLRVAA